MNTGANIKSNIRDNVLLAMSVYINNGMLEILQKVIENEFVKVNMDEITTLPAVMEEPVEKQNEYYLKLFVLKKKNLRPKTLQQYVSAVRRLVGQIEKPLNKMDDLDIDYYLRQYVNRNKYTTGKINNPQTVNNERRFLSAFFTWMRKARMIQDNPVENTEMCKVDKKPIDYFTDDEMEQLREGCETFQERALVEVFRSTGCRIGEIVTINRTDINWATGDIIVLGEKGGGYRTVYLDETARHHIKKYLDTRKYGNDGLFTTDKAPYNQLQPEHIRKIFKEIGNRSNMSGRIYPHKFRKTLGMKMKNKGIDIGIIQEILGHQSPATTSKYYAESTAETLRDVRRRVA